jgi:hypothetical protein
MVTVEIEDRPPQIAADSDLFGLPFFVVDSTEHRLTSTTRHIGQGEACPLLRRCSPG